METKPKIHVLIADDHEMIRLALASAIGEIATEMRFSFASDGPSTLDALGGHAADPPPDLALIDFMMPGIDGLAWFRALRSELPQLRIVVMSGREDADLVKELVNIGVSGFIPKSESATRLVLALRMILAGGTYAPLRFLTGTHLPRPLLVGNTATMPKDATGLTERQLRVLQLLAEGLPNKLIARKLGLSESTIKVHLLAIYRGFGVNNRTEAVVAAARHFDRGR